MKFYLVFSFQKNIYIKTKILYFLDIILQIQYTMITDIVCTFLELVLQNSTNNL